MNTWFHSSKYIFQLYSDLILIQWFETFKIIPNAKNIYLRNKAQKSKSKKKIVIDCYSPRKLAYEIKKILLDKSAFATHFAAFLPGAWGVKYEDR